MSVSTITIRFKRVRKEKRSLSDSDKESRSSRGHKVLRSRIIVSDNDRSASNSTVLSDSPDGVAAKV